MEGFLQKSQDLQTICNLCHFYETPEILAKAFPKASPYRNSAPTWYTTKVTAQVTAIWKAAVSPVQAQLSDSFLMVAKVAAQGTYSREKVMRA